MTNTHSTDESWEYSENICPDCHGFLHRVYCWDCGGAGWFDDYEEDAINFGPGESFTACSNCNGKGFEEWCPNMDCIVAGGTHD